VPVIGLLPRSLNPLLNVPEALENTIPYYTLSVYIVTVKPSISPISFPKSRKKDWMSTCSVKVYCKRTELPGTTLVRVRIRKESGETTFVM